MYLPMVLPASPSADDTTNGAHITLLNNTFTANKWGKMPFSVDATLLGSAMVWVVGQGCKVSKTEQGMLV
jgi:hypothetical protein